MSGVFIENEQDDEAAVRAAVRELDADRLSDLAEHAARLLAQQEAEK